jgi:enoyl-CoA hydratase/carnithine racemase
MILTEKLDSEILAITLNRPEKFNSLTAELIDELIQAFENPPRVIILRGAGGNFCSGADLKEASSLEEIFKKIAQLYQAVLSSPAIVIAEVTGVCYAGGFGLALCSDLALGAADSRYCLPEVRRGFLPALLTTLLELRTTAAFAKQMALLASPYTAQEIYDKGILNFIHPPETLAQATFDLAKTILEGAPEAIRLQKKMMQKNLDFSLAGSWQTKALATGEYLEGLKAFKEKRKPSWVSF